MATYQVTARFDNLWEIVGADTVTRVEADRLASIQHNVGRDVRIHEIRGSGSRVIVERTR